MKSLKLVDVYRVMNPEKRIYSCHHKQDRSMAWRFDQIWIPESLRERVKKVDIWKCLWGSDHAPISIEVSREGELMKAEGNSEMNTMKPRDRAVGSTSTVCRLGRSLSKPRSLVLLCKGQLNNTELDKVIDTGAQVSCVSKRIWERLGKPSVG